MDHDLLYPRESRPFGKSWEKWATIWCRWLLSIPKKSNPSLDQTGKRCSKYQTDRNVWFLTGTFGNVVPVRRKCIIPAGKAIFFPILVKEDSFEEDPDLNSEIDLINRARDATDRVIHMEAKIDGEKVENLERYRALSEVFDLTFPRGNVYDLRNTTTRSVCDGYWLFIKPLRTGKHCIYFEGENLLDEFTVNHLRGTKVYRPNWQYYLDSSTFTLRVSYEIIVLDQ
jgi:hypothetical protein